MTDNKDLEEIKGGLLTIKIKLARIETYLKNLLNYDDEMGKEKEDELINEAARLLSTEEYVSASFLQKKLRIGYARAACILDQLEKKGLIGPGQGANPRRVVIKK